MPVHIPKVIQDIGEIEKTTTNEIIVEEYKKKVKLFINEVSAEVDRIVKHYENVISSLTEENNSLKSLINLNYSPQSSNRRMISPIKELTTQQKNPTSSINVEMLETAKSKMYSPQRTQIFQGLHLGESHIKSMNLETHTKNHFPEELIDPKDELAQSRFAEQRNLKRQRQNQLIDRLEAGQKNLTLNTSRYLSLVGKDQPLVSAKYVENEELDHENQSKPRETNSMNQSLSNICSSLDNSFVSRQRRSEKKKTAKIFQQEAQKKKEEQEKLTSMVKQRGVKNLLEQLRENVNSSPHKAPEIIKQSKLFTCGESKKASKNNAKVMINPVPVNIGRKRNRSRSPCSPERKPHSILKQSSTILTRSLSGISVIDLIE